jgi:hypothetical protein
MFLKRASNNSKQKVALWSLLHSRTPTDPRWKHRATCHDCGQCTDGYETDSKYTSANTPIPLAMRTGNLSRCSLSRDNAH